MYLWVVYGDDGLPDMVCDSAHELADYMGIAYSTVFYRINKGDPQIARIRDDYPEDEEVTK